MQRPKNNQPQAREHDASPEQSLEYTNQNGAFEVCHRFRGVPNPCVMRVIMRVLMRMIMRVMMRVRMGVLRRLTR